MTTVLITGANRGIGLELARRSAAQGDRVLACCRTPDAADALQALAREHASVSLHAVEVTNADSVRALAAALAGTAIEVLINNAGTSGPKQQSLAEMDFEGWAETFAVNTLAPFRVLQALRGNLKAAAAAGGHARNVTITSQMGAIAWGFPVSYAYCASKAAVNKVMKMASVELVKDGITSVLVHPGWVRTDMGGQGADLAVDESASGILRVIAGLGPADNGTFLKWNGEPHAW